VNGSHQSAVLCMLQHTFTCGIVSGPRSIFLTCPHGGPTGEIAIVTAVQRTRVEDSLCETDGAIDR